MPYDSMAAWDRNNFEFNDAIQRRCASLAIFPPSPHSASLTCHCSGFSWTGQFSFDYGPGSTISRDDYIPPSPPSSDEEAPRFTDAILTWSPPPSPRASPPPSPRVDSAISLKAPSPTSPTLNSKDKTRLANRLYAAACSGDLENLRFLLNLGADINKPAIIRDLYDAFKPPKPGTLSALAGAAGNGQLDACELLLSEGAALNPDMKQSSSAPLHQACKANDVEIARFLLEVGADVDALNCYKTTPLMYCVKYGSPDLVSLILTYNPDLSITSFIHTAAIHWAVWPNHEQNMELLLQAGADPNQIMGDGSTPLHCAAGGGFTEMVRLLLDFGADPRIRNQDFMTAAKVAEEEGQGEMAEVLRVAERVAREEERVQREAERVVRVVSI